MISWLTSVANVPNSVHKSLLVAPAIYGLLVRKLYEVKELIQERCGRYSQIGGGELAGQKVSEPFQERSSQNGFLRSQIATHAND